MKISHREISDLQAREIPYLKGNLPTVKILQKEIYDSLKNYLTLRHILFLGENISLKEKYLIHEVISLYLYRKVLSHLNVNNSHTFM